MAAELYILLPAVLNLGREGEKAERLRNHDRNIQINSSMSTGSALSR